jgi:rhodanese-related sulfurtransferase
VPGIAAADTTPNEFENITACDAKEMIKGGHVFLLDVRTPAEFKAAHIEGAVLIPFKNVPSHDPVILPDEMLLPASLSEVPEDKPVIVYCFSGGRSINATKLLVKNGNTDVYNVEHGITEWIDSKLPVVSTFVDESDIEDCIKHSLNAKIKRVFLHLEKGDKAKAKQELCKFTNFVNTSVSPNQLTSRRADYLRN